MCLVYGRFLSRFALCGICRIAAITLGPSVKLFIPHQLMQTDSAGYVGCMWTTYYTMGYCSFAKVFVPRIGGNKSKSVEFNYFC